mmetsp:Transcript_30038/g.60134  ORF Transcript_30038/g.60134 Transcript_30038/m.60134 type:complete len:202 (-) Transcript_30038:166-771(-)
MLIRIVTVVLMECRWIPGRRTDENWRLWWMWSRLQMRRILRIHHWGHWWVWRRRMICGIRQRVSDIYAVEVRLSIWMWQQLSLVCCGNSLHQLCEERKPSEEAFMIIRTKVWASLMKALEAPTAQLTGEALVLGLSPVFRNDFRHHQIFVEDLPSAAMRHPANNMTILRIGQNAVKLGREIVGRFAISSMECGVIWIGRSK